MIEVEVLEVDLSSEFLLDYKDMVQRQKDFIKNDKLKAERKERRARSSTRAKGTRICGEERPAV